jgi:UDPglucose--hexose-1-phosphate uridylyltransferase
MDFHPEPVSDDTGFCPFCEGHEDKTPPEILGFRENRQIANGPGWNVRVVPNKFPALRIEGEMGKAGVGMYDKMNGIGAHEVIIETPDHFRKLDMHTRDSLAKVFQASKNRIIDLNNDKRFKYILVFKNEGRQAGASLSHPHSQLIATPVTPKRVKEELMGAKEFFNYKDRCVFCDIIREELSQGVRIIYENKGFVSFSPFASRFPFEIWVLPKRHSPDFQTIEYEEMLLLADILIVTMKKLAVALNRPQYNLVLHTGPVRWARMGYWVTLDMDYHWHIEIMPKLTQVAGFEWGTGFYINPTVPEEAAKFLREIEA